MRRAFAHRCRRQAAPVLWPLPPLPPPTPGACALQVRPPLAVLLRALRPGSAPGPLASLERELHAGHWVLAFGSAEAAAAAAGDAERYIHRLRALYCQLLAPLTCAPLGWGEEAEAGASGAPGSLAGPAPAADAGGSPGTAAAAAAAAVEGARGGTLSVSEPSGPR